MQMQSLGKEAPILIAVVLLMGQLAGAGVIEGRIPNKGPMTDLSNFVIYLDDLEGPFPTPKESAVMDQVDLSFIPHVLVIRTGTTVEFPNSDPISHNVFSISEAKRFNLGLYQRGEGRQMKFDKPGVVELLCNVHLEMSAYIIVVKTPYFARTGPDGAFRIPDVPAGQYRVRGWHENLAIQAEQIVVPDEGTVNVIFSMRS